MPEHFFTQSINLKLLHVGNQRTPSALPRIRRNLTWGSKQDGRVRSSIDSARNESAGFKQTLNSKALFAQL